ncbi:hypothetical protein HOY82DRAFT_596953 [Tuber indicum]|nr:hypothetical protein HOY82DRAFT_596953 [Tuber indicum]
MDIAGLVIGSVGIVGGVFHGFKRTKRLLFNHRAYTKELGDFNKRLEVEVYFYEGTSTRALSLLNVEKFLATDMLDNEDHAH